MTSDFFVRFERGEDPLCSLGDRTANPARTEIPGKRKRAAGTDFPRFVEGMGEEGQRAGSVAKVGEHALRQTRFDREAGGLDGTLNRLAQVSLGRWAKQGVASFEEASEAFDTSEFSIKVCANGKDRYDPPRLRRHRVTKQCGELPLVIPSPTHRDQFFQLIDDE